MALAAAQVVDAIAARLAGTATTVTTKRFHPFTEADLRAWRVVPAGEAMDTSSEGAMEFHELGIECHGYVRALDDVDDALSDMAAAGLTAIHAVQAGNFTVRTASIERRFTPDGEAATAEVVLALTSNFATATAAPEVLL